MTVGVKHTVETRTTKTFADGHKETSTATSAYTVSVKSLLDKFVDLQFQESPTACIMFGVRKYEDRRVFSLSKEDALAARERLVDLQTEVKAFLEQAGDALSAKEAADIAFLLETIDMDLTARGIPGEQGYSLELSENHMSSAFVYLEMTFMDYQREETAEDLRNCKTRLELVGPQFDYLIENLRNGIRRGVTLNKESIELFIKKLAGNAGPEFSSEDEATEFATKSVLNKAVKAKELLDDEHFFVPVIRDVIVPGFKKAKKFLEEEYAQHARKNAGIYGLPNYKEEYATAIFQNTTVRYTAEEVHQIGLAEVARIQALMEETKNKIGFEGTLYEFQTALQDKEKYPNLFYENPDDVLNDYNKIVHAAKAKMVDYFEKFPKFECVIEPIPAFLEEQAPLAMYQPGTPEKAGKFVFNRRLHKTKPSHQKTALCLHEANPGHHHQVSLAFENTDLHLANRMAFHTGYAEGWGLYSEYLGEEMGFYSDPFEYFGRLELEMWRAVRLVVDSGLHAKGWSIEESVDYMLSKVSISRAEAETEAKRYSVWPGQALAYKIGEIKIKDLRKYAESELGDKFDIKKFHSQIIDYGSVPLGTLETIVKKWVASVKSA
ncbi:UNVERIFIED_CONTAM: hypothetical protein HDU68_012645 [Siphonaria sp. JEL0065]|nr:hypothetical protein HDU68_012645 [Siphonaria sp. JEL0065]